MVEMLPISGRVDAAGRLVEAAPRLLDLLRRAGGEVGAPIALPEVAGLARLAQRLGIAIDRTIVVADGDDDLELGVRAEPDDRGAALVFTGWRPRAAWRGADDDAPDVDDGSADWTWQTDAALRLVRIEGNDDATALLGEPLTRLFDFAEDEAGASPVLSAIAGRDRFAQQAANDRTSGLPVLLSGAPRMDGHDRFAGYTGTVHVRDPAVVSSGPQSSMQGFAGHLDRALRAPLERIIANAGSMSAEVDGPLASSYAGYADDIASAGRHLLGLVTDLVDLEAIERADFVVEPESVDLADVARRAAGLLSVRATEAGVRIDRPAADETLAATGDFRRALQVLVNLIANGLRYSPGGGMLWVRVERDGDRACVIVADQGKGIAREDQALIFEKFGRVDPGEAGGSGLGLYISRRLARAMGGDLSVDSAPGQGARFVFTLPAR